MHDAQWQHPRRRSGFFGITFFTDTCVVETLQFASAPHGHRTPRAVWWCDAAISRYSQKTCLFGRFFTSSQNIKWRHFRSYRRFTAMFEQAELRGTQMGPNGPPNAKETAQIAPEIAILQNRAFGDVTETAILAILASLWQNVSKVL